MDVDVSMSSEEDYIQYFDLSPTHFAWREPRPHEIEVRRAHMSDMLIFDILLSSGGIRHPDTLYPPADTNALQRLLDAISNSNFDGLKQDCLVYFLLKWHQDGREEDFRIRRCIPPQFSALSDAYWHLDSGIHIARAVSLLSDARLNRDYPSKVIQSLSLAEESHTLIRTFVRTAKPLLTEPDDIDAYTVALAESTLSEAWSYQRSFSEMSDTRKRLLRKILDWCLAPKPRLTPLTHLLAFPFSTYEQSLVHSYALDPPDYLPDSSIPVIQDLVCVRLVQGGQHAAAIKLDRQFSSIPRGGEKGQKAAHDRRQMLDELMNAMPAAERHLLELELEQFAQGRGMGNGKGKEKASDLGASTSSLSMSWEHITPGGANGTIKSSVAPLTQPIPQRSNAPRFGGQAPATSASEGIFPSISRSHPIFNGAPSTSAAPQVPKPPSHGPFPFGGISAQPASATSATVAKGWTLKTSQNGFANGAPSQNLFGNRQSLFETAGSANAVPNAFYQPSHSTNAKRPLFSSVTGQPAPTPPVSVFATLASNSRSVKPSKSGRQSIGGVDADTSISSINGPNEVDISMLSELSDSDSARADDSISVARALDNSADMDISGEFSVSVFRHHDGDSTRKIATDKGARIARTETEAKLPPGAFLPDDEHEKEQSTSAQTSVSASALVSASKGRERRRTRASASGRGAPRVPPPPPVPEPVPEPPRTRTSMRSRRAVKAKDLGRSIPGSLMDTDDDSDDVHAKEEEREEDDDVAPLPALTPARRTRKSTSQLSEAAPRPTRRSSRLSAVPSVGSSSPEPVSPVKPSASTRRKSVRTSNVGAVPKTPAKTRKRKA